MNRLLHFCVPVPIAPPTAPAPPAGRRSAGGSVAFPHTAARRNPGRRWPQESAPLCKSPARRGGPPCPSWGLSWRPPTRAPRYRPERRAAPPPLPRWGHRPRRRKRVYTWHSPLPPHPAPEPASPASWGRTPAPGPPEQPQRSAVFSISSSPYRHPPPVNPRWFSLLFSTSYHGFVETSI